MNTFAKTLAIGTLPAFLTGSLAAAPGAPPSTQPATQPSTQPAPANIADASEPLVIPDGTSRERPGPGSTSWQSGIPEEIVGIRQ